MNYPPIEASLGPVLGLQGWVVLILFCLLLGMVGWYFCKFIGHIPKWIKKKGKII
jgi:hypothetical protein